MVRKSTWILFGVFVVILTGGIFLNRRMDGSQSEKTPTPTAIIKAIPEKALANLLEISYSNRDGNVLDIYKQKDGSWSAPSDTQKKFNQARVTELTSNLASLEVLSELPSSINTADLGLSQPSHQITLRTGQDDNFIIKVGNPTPTGSGYYVQAGGLTPVIVGKGGVETILNLLTEDNLVIQPTFSP